MNKTIKILMAILVLLAILLLVVTLSVDGILKNEIEEQGTEMLKTKVVVEDVDVSMFSGQGSIKGFAIENPEGFSDQPAFTFEQADIKVVLSSLFSDKIVVKELIIHHPVVLFEQQETNINLKTLNDNLEAASTEDSDKLLVIDHLLIEEGTIRLSSTIDRERQAEVSMDAFELYNIGREGNNNVKESMKQILEPLLEQAIKEAARKGLFEQLENKLQDILNK